MTPTPFTSVFAGNAGFETITDWLARTGKEWSPEVNKEWLEAMKKEGAIFHDIGPDFDRRLRNKIDSNTGRPPSKPYGSERRGLSEYEDYIKLYERDGKYNVVPEIDSK
jgi:hypothetical protein